MRYETTPIPDLIILTPKRLEDERGFLSESWSLRGLAAIGIRLPDFVQDNHSFSRQANTVRGLHFQSPPHAQGKLVRCGRGRLFDVAVDIRRGSPTYGNWFGTELSFMNGRQLWIPPGFLHGFVTYEPETEICYKCTGHYSPAHEGQVAWDSLGIDWPLNGPAILSQKDASAQSFASFQSPFTYKASA